METILKSRFKKWQRHPGSHGEGHTEFFAVDCLAKMLALADDLGVRGLGGHLSRGIDPAECTVNSETKGNSALARKQQGARAAQRYALKQREKAEWGEHITLELGMVRYMVRDFRDHLVWVDLSHWHELLAVGEGARRPERGMLDLYFGRFRPPLLNDEEEEGDDQLHTAESFTIWVERYQREAVRKHSSLLSKYCPKAMFHLREPLDNSRVGLPQSICAGTLLLRVQCGRFIPRQPFLAEFETIARQIESRRTLEQLAFDL